MYVWQCLVSLELLVIHIMYVWQCLVSLELLVIVKEKQLCQK